MNSICFTISGLLFESLLCIIFFTKKRIKLIENDAYAGMIISGTFASIVEIISFILVNNKVPSNSIIYIYTIKSLFLMFLIWVSFFTLYYVITNRKLRKVKELDYNKLIRILLAIYIVILLLPISIKESNGILLPVGIGVNIIYVFAFSFILIMLFSMIISRKFISGKKYIPLYVTLALFFIVVLMQKIFPELFLINFVFCIISFTMYFTIENPDIKMIEELEKAKLEAEKANRAKTEFLSNMSHEIRTPLNAINGFSDCLFEEETLEAAKQDAKDIKIASDNLLEIVNGILDISKIEANKMEIIETEYKLATILDSLEKMTRVRLDDKPIDFEVKYASDLPEYLYGDGQKLRQILTNLLTNAVKYTERGKIMFRINTVNENGYTNLVMSVEDTGRGIKDDKIDTLFNKFERLEEDKNTTLEGTGLGLAITKKLVEMMGGKIVVQSKYGQGSKFTVYLKQKIVTNPTIKEEDNNKELAVMFENKKVLLVDDNKINLKVAAKMLLNHGIESVNVESGFDCIEEVKKQKYDLILLDDMMPKMSGSETLIELKKIEGFSTPVVVTTANAIEGMREEYINDKGFDDYLSKPIEKVELINILNKYLN